MPDCFVFGDRSIAVLIIWNEIIQKKEKTLETEWQRLHPDPLYPAVAVPTATGCSGSGHPTNRGWRRPRLLQSQIQKERGHACALFWCHSCSDPSNGRSEKQCWSTLFGPASSVTTYGSLLPAFLHLYFLWVEDSGPSVLRLWVGFVFLIDCYQVFCDQWSSVGKENGPVFFPSKRIYGVECVSDRVFNWLIC